MIEWLLIPSVIAGAALIPKGKMSDEKKIKRIFENRKIQIGKEEKPRLINKETTNFGMTYCYSLPIGIPHEIMVSLEDAIKEALNKEIEWEFKNGYLLIHVYESKLPESWDYDETLIREGTWEIPVGKNHQGIIYHDFDKYQHILCGGTTRYGKTVLLKNVMGTLLLNQPEHVNIYILDLKGGLEFTRYEKFPQVKRVASNLQEACEVLIDISKQIKEREELFRANCWSNIVETPIKERTFIIVDEGSELSPKFVHPKLRKYADACMLVLSEIARISGGLGFRLIYCTQYPVKDAVPMSVKVNIVSRISFTVPEQVASQVILDESGAEDLPTIPGRAIYKVAKSKVLQVPYVDDRRLMEMLGGNTSANGRKEVGENGEDTSNHRPTRDGNNQTVVSNS
jgi:DNA segregation ATPase FtsK/SpoIIIE, S-DNA-T family